MQALDTYSQIMMESKIRKQAVDNVISKIKQNSERRKFSENSLKQMYNLLVQYEVEDGVTVFFTSGVPKGKEKIAEIDIGSEYAIFWWGNNLNKRNVSNPCKYGLGVQFVRKRSSNTNKCVCAVDELTRKFPDFTDLFKQFKAGDTFKLYVYAKAGDFYRAVCEKSGDWLLQTPQGKSFIPSRPIGKCIDGGKEIHIFYPKNDVKKDRIMKNITIS